jgi:adenylate cyclase
MNQHHAASLDRALMESLPPKLNNRYSTYLGPAPKRPPISAPKAKLVYTDMQGDHKSIFIDSNLPLTIGRKEDNSIVLTCAKTSKYHATVERSKEDPEPPRLDAPGWYWLRDRNSSNGVKLNDVYISQSTPLAHGDQIQIGTILMRFYYILESEQELPHAYSSRDTFKQNQAFNSQRSSFASPDHINLVTILPSERKYEETVSIRTELDEPLVHDFPKVDETHDLTTLKEDYEKLRLAYELSKMSYTSDVQDHLTKMLDLMFSVLPVDRGVVLLVDKSTSLLVTNMVKLREGKGYEGREILLSSTILQRVYRTRKSLITADAFEDPDLGKAKSIAIGQIRSVLCVPIIAHDDVLGIVHLDSKDRINTFLEKDLSLVQTIINQTALQIENSILFATLQTEIRVTEQLQRFLPPQVVSRMVKKEGIISKGGREVSGTIVFVDIRGFTRLSEKSSPSEVFDLLNDYFERLVQIVFKYNGIVDKFIGDALMAVFGTMDDPLADPTPSVLNSVHAAMEFKIAIAELNLDRQRHGKEPIAIGVGLNTGRLMSGFMGASQRMEFTCIGDTVNLASRICDYANVNQVLLSEETARYVQGRIDVRFFEVRQFKGKVQETRVYEAVGVLDDGTDGLIESQSELSTVL